ncbi:CHAT domain-containing protein [Sphingomonas jatrophae]|uniref:CHAT domain-containing protein n=1 Tax=Sphingomonas jatrophae TaxID=1166337 RepID=A0A1I6LKM9_9SPHN|nr:CHAT domain-containing protein [Sphingomonas jatrophae]SFS03938.1 CHAT domain-containing protein [Sphingomonas jatrophae]
MIRRSALLPAGLLSAGLPLLLAGCASASGGGGVLPDRIALGRDGTGEPCIANRNWKDPQLGGPFDRAYALTCRSVAASRPVGSVAAVLTREAKAEDAALCGAPGAVTFRGQPAEARRCFDKALGTQTVVVRFTRGGQTYRGSATPSVQGPMEAALAALAGLGVPADTGTAAPTSFQTTELAAAPGAGEAGGYDAGFDAQIALREGIVLNRQGQSVDASRVLNDALSRLPRGALPGTRAELALEAGLADSNIRFNDASDDHFALAKTLLDENPNVDRAPFLLQKLSVYRALDRLNRRDWTGALTALDVKLQPEGSLLQNSGLLADLNQAPQDSATASAVVGGPSTAELNQYVINAQRYWAASVAYLARGGTDAVAQSQAALDGARDNLVKLLGGRIDPASVLWLIAQVERQSGRLDARRAEVAGGDAVNAGYATAIAKFDCAVAALQATLPPSTAAGQCAVPLSDATRARLISTNAIASGPIAAETQMERAGLLRRAGAPTERVLADYNTAVDALIATSRSSGGTPTGIENYLDLLTEEAKANPSSDAAERFFRAVQAIGEPGIARQMSQLQSIVTSGGTTAARVRDRTELGRELSSLRYAITAEQDPARRTSLEQQRDAKQAQLDAIEAELGANSRLAQIDDRPVTVADIQGALQPGEIYLKLVEIRAREYGIVIGKDQVQVYPLAAPARDLKTIASVVRLSIRDEADRRIPVFRVRAANGLFNLIAGPARDQINAAKAIVVDPAGPLVTLPVGVLVTDTESVKAYEAAGATARNDYSKVAFLAAQADISNALSPRSFLISRKTAESTARNAFIGFGEHAPPPPVMVASRGPVSLGLGCPIEFTELARALRESEPISARRIAIAADALGVPNAPRVTGAAFTDTAVTSEQDLDQYQVLHFATHGLPEQQVGCTDIPPSLITSVGEGASDGFLSFSEIAGLRLNANLVVLAACQTSAGLSRELARQSGQEEAGKSLEGLVRAFLTANARAVLATYWKVSVEAESDALFKTFYETGRRKSIGDALRVAQGTLMKSPRYSHPYYWGAYFIVGDASKTMLSPTKG